MNASELPPADRILVIDDNSSIHADFKKILAPDAVPNRTLQEAETVLFGAPRQLTAGPTATYRIDCALQGQEGLALVEKAVAEGHPYALAFVDVRMPPGWDGVETISRIWQVYPELPIVICTAYSDYSWSEMMSRLGYSDNLVVLRKPFEAVEVLQLAHSFTRKWLLARQVRAHIEKLDILVQSRTKHLQKAHEELGHSEERFAKAFRSNPVPLALQNAADQRFVDVNDSFVRLTGYSREDILGRGAAELNLFSQAGLPGDILQLLQGGERVANRPCEVQSRDGKVFQVLISAEIFELQQQPHCLFSIEDITERLHIEEQLRQAQKMEAVGQIAAGVAHDFNNILTVIQGHAELQLGSAADESLHDSLQEISRAAARAASLVRQLLAFSRKQMLHRRPLHIARTLDGLGKMLHRVLGETITLEVHCPTDLPAVLADAVNFEQIVINLAVNARDAMPDGGPLTISADVVAVDAEYRERVPDAVIGRFIRLSVADQGVGMDKEICSRIFEPFFTTKDIGKGTGMGLATVYGIVKQHQGWIEVDSAPGEGSVFRVFLPVADKGDSAAANRRKPLHQSGSSKTVLLAEDEAPVREMSVKVLEKLGFRVIAAKDGPEALARWSQNRSSIDLLLTDMVMPGGMTGRELARRIRREQPRLPVIYSTGYSADLFHAGDAQTPDHAECLLKPYDASALIEAVNRAITAPFPEEIPAGK